MTPLQACPICDAPARVLEHMARGSQLCTRCGFFFRLDDQGELVEWATTNKSHPRGIWWDARRQMSAVALAAVLVGLLAASCATAGTTAPAAPPRPRVTLDEALPGELEICVPVSPFVTYRNPVTCLSLSDLRAQLRGRRLIREDSVSRNRFTLDQEGSR